MERNRGQRKWILGLVALSAIVGTLAVACGGDESPNETAAEAASSAPGVDTAEQRLAEARQDPEFVAPGPPVDASKAEGHTVFYLGVNLAIPVVSSLVRALEEAGTAAGVNVEPCDGKGSPAEFARCMDTAIATLRAGDVIIISGIPSQLLSAQVKRARAADLHVFVDSETEEGKPPLLPEVEATSNPNFPRAGRLMADGAIVDSGGDANILVVVSKDIPDSLQVRDGVRAEVEELCPDCTVKVVETTAANWASQIQTLVRTALTRDPTIDYIAPTFDGMVQFVVPAIRGTGAADRVKIVTSTTTPAVMELLKKREIVLTNVDVLGGDWMAWAWMDQSLRLINGADPVSSTQVPTRVFDRENIDTIDPAGPKTTWFGADFQSEYKKLWGVGE